MHDDRCHEFANGPELGRRSTLQFVRQLRDGLLVAGEGARVQRDHVVAFLGAFERGRDLGLLSVQFFHSSDEVFRRHACDQLNKRPDDRKLVRQLRAVAAKHLSLCKKVGSDFLAETEEAGLMQLNPEADVGQLHIAVTEWIIEHGHKQLDLIDLLTTHLANLDHWLKATGETYKQRDIGMLVLVPFLRLIADHGITTSSKNLPLHPMVQALFDWLGVEKQLRLSVATISGTARRLSGGSASKSTANRRPKT